MILRLRSGKALGSNWTERAGDLQIYSNTLRNTGTSYSDNGNSFAVAWEFGIFAAKLQLVRGIAALGQGYVPGSKVRAVENALVKMAHRGNELRKAQLLQTPPVRCG